jgi:hypothetical protein
MTGAADIRPKLVDEILGLLTKRGGAGEDSIGIIEGNASIDALLKVTAFLIATGPQTRTRAERRALVEAISKYLHRQIITFQRAKAAGQFEHITSISTEGLH